MIPAMSLLGLFPQPIGRGLGLTMMGQLVLLPFNTEATASNFIDPLVVLSTLRWNLGMALDLDQPLTWGRAPSTLKNSMKTVNEY